jgi:hypothetical protein
MNGHEAHVAANIPIDINQNEIPTKSSVAKKAVAALAAGEIFFSSLDSFS